VTQPGPTDTTDDLFCPLCGQPVPLTLQLTEYGAEPAGECFDCNAIVEVL
jgi:hypothetical protein